MGELAGSEKFSEISMMGIWDMEHGSISSVGTWMWNKETVGGDHKERDKSSELEGLCPA